MAGRLEASLPARGRRAARAGVGKQEVRDGGMAGAEGAGCMVWRSGVGPHRAACRCVCIASELCPLQHKMQHKISTTAIARAPTPIQVRTRTRTRTRTE
jgi:hypothetical protein